MANNRSIAEWADRLSFLSLFRLNPLSFSYPVREDGLDNLGVAGTSGMNINNRKLIRDCPECL